MVTQAYKSPKKILADSASGLSPDRSEAVIEAVARIIAEAVSSETSADLRSAGGSDRVEETASQVLAVARSEARVFVVAPAGTDTNAIRDSIEASLRNDG